MNKIIYGIEEVEDMTHLKPTLVYMLTNSKCLYYRKGKCLMCVKCKHERFKDNEKKCRVRGRSNIALRMV